MSFTPLIYVDSTVLLTPQSKTPRRHCDTAERSLAAALWHRGEKLSGVIDIVDSDSTESELFYHDQRKLFNGKSDEKYVREHFALLELKSGFENLVIKNKFCYMDISAMGCWAARSAAGRHELKMFLTVYKYKLIYSCETESFLRKK